MSESDEKKAVAEVPTPTQAETEAPISPPRPLQEIKKSLGDK